MNMKKGCNLDLELGLSSSDECSSSSPRRQSSQDLHQLTIFYNGVMSVCDVTEFQARAIICVANNEMGKIVVKTRTTTPSSSPTELSSASNCKHYYPLCSSRVTPGGLSMKKSLQKFLQKRKHRSRATHPYRTTAEVQISFSQSDRAFLKD